MEEVEKLKTGGSAGDGSSYMIMIKNKKKMLIMMSLLCISH